MLVVLAVVALALLVMQYLPERVTYEGSTSNPAAAPAEVVDVLPFRDVAVERAQETAKAILAEFGELQDRVEFEELGLETYRTNYDAIIELANAADATFAQREFDDAITQYRDATDRLREYVDHHETEFERTFERGVAALEDRNVENARESLSLAATHRPNDPALGAAFERLAKLPEVNKLILESMRAQERGDFAEAERLLHAARNVDPATKGLVDRIQVLRKTQRDIEFKNIVTQGYAALNEGYFDKAKDEFEAALRMRPNDSAAKTGLNEVTNRLGNVSISQLRERAERFERSGDLQNAIKTYSQVLDIDNTIQFARQGYERNQKTVTLVAALERVIADPAMLSTNKEFEAAQKTLNDAQGHAPIRAEHPGKLEKFRELIETASRPLPIVLVSDNTMQVRLATIGDLGPFDRKELSLRPGRYLITGSANGCRDVRKTIIVAEGMDPIAIVCDEPI